MRVKLKTKFGQFWDRRLRWGITAGEVKDLPEPLSQDTLTYQKLRMGGFEIIHEDASVAPASAPECSETSQPAVTSAVWDAPVMEVTDISSVIPDATPPVGRAAPDDSVSPDIGVSEGTAATDRPTEPGSTHGDVIASKEGIQDGSSIELRMTHGSPIESGMTTEPETTNRPAETPIPLATKPAPKKRGRPKKAK